MYCSTAWHAIGYIYPTFSKSWLSRVATSYLLIEPFCLNNDFLEPLCATDAIQPYFFIFQYQFWIKLNYTFACISILITNNTFTCTNVNCRVRVRIVPAAIFFSVKFIIYNIYYNWYNIGDLILIFYNLIKIVRMTWYSLCQWCKQRLWAWFFRVWGGRMVCIFFFFLAMGFNVFVF